MNSAHFISLAVCCAFLNGCSAISDWEVNNLSGTDLELHRPRHSSLLIKPGETAICKKVGEPVWIVWGDKKGFFALDEKFSFSRDRNAKVTKRSKVTFLEKKIRIVFRAGVEMRGYLTRNKSQAWNSGYWQKNEQWNPTPINRNAPNIR